MLTDKNKYSWLAGLIEGEGCLSIYYLPKKKYLHSERKNACWERKLIIVNTSLELIKFLKEYFGGTYYIQRKVNLARKTAYQWMIWGDNLKAMLLKIIPFLKSKRKIAELLLKSYDYKGDNILLHKLAWEILQLKNSNKGRKNLLTCPY